MLVCVYYLDLIYQNYNVIKNIPMKMHKDKLREKHTIMFTHAQSNENRLT